MRVLRTVVPVLACAVGLASLISDLHMPANTDAPLLAGARVRPEVRAAIDRACRDCHSEATRYPWYSYIAPVSYLVQDDVRRGRERLNFSRWSEYPLIRRERLLSEIANQVQDGGMPLPVYTYLHRDAKLSKAEVEVIFGWTQKERARLIAEATGQSPPP
jgi:hypothetical protein